MSARFQGADSGGEITPRLIDSPLRLQTVIWNSSGPGSVGYTVTELLDNMPAAVERRLWLLGGHPWRSYVTPALPSLLFRALCKARVTAQSQGKIARWSVLNALRAGDILYIWPPFDLQLIERARGLGAIVVAERVSCMAELLKSALAPAFDRRSLPWPSTWCTPEAVEEERQQMLACNFVTAPNAFVAKSIKIAGIPENCVLHTSYGFSPSRLASAIGITRPKRDPVFAFVGTGGIAKGLDVLLEAWQKAAVTGKLLLAGRVDGDIKRDYGPTLSRSDVEQLGFVQDIATVYAAADVFVFPSHQEGGPQVTYEAAACGLPCIVSPMGAGRLVRDEIEGLLINPCSVDELAAAISRLAEDMDFRKQLAANAESRALEFTWAKVSRQRYQQLSEAVKSAMG